jgi:hypothetical protein
MLNHGARHTFVSITPIRDHGQGFRQQLTMGEKRANARIARHIAEFQAWINRAR